MVAVGQKKKKQHWRSTETAARGGGGGGEGVGSIPCSMNKEAQPIYKVYWVYLMEYCMRWHMIHDNFDVTTVDQVGPDVDHNRSGSMQLDFGH